MKSALKVIGVATMIMATVGLTASLLMHRALVPSDAQLTQIDAAARGAAPPGSSVRRLRAPDQIEWDGKANLGYFTYEVIGKTSPGQYRADWRIADDKVELLSFRRL